MSVGGTLERDDVHGGGLAGAPAALHDRSVFRPARSRDGFLFDRVDACGRLQASIEMIAAAGCSPDVLVLSGDAADHQGEAGVAGCAR